MSEETTPPDPMKGFRGVMAGTLVMEAITVGLALPVIDRLGDGISSVAGWLAGAVALALLVLCAFVRKSWITVAVLAVQVVLLGFFFLETAVGIIGVLFLAVWVWLFWLRGKVAKRLADGTLPSQQE